MESYGFYSQECANNFGFAIYDNNENEQIKVTYICDKLSDVKDNKWKDLKYVGKVIICVNVIKIDSDNIDSLNYIFNKMIYNRENYIEEKMESID